MRAILLPFVLKLKHLVAAFQSAAHLLRAWMIVVAVDLPPSVGGSRNCQVNMIMPTVAGAMMHRDPLHIFGVISKLHIGNKLAGDLRPLFLRHPLDRKRGV